MKAIEAHARAAASLLSYRASRDMSSSVSRTGKRASSSGVRLGVEHEMFVVDERGAIAPVAELLLEVCRNEAPSRGLDPGCFEAECSGHLVEIKTPPCDSMQELSKVYLESLRLATEAARGLGLRLYPLGTYPLPVAPAARLHPHYELKSRVLGLDRFAHACRCAGLHIHLEAPPGSLRPDGVPALTARREQREGLLDLYNLATALDPALVALGRSCPFYEGAREPGAARTLRYRGGFGVEAVYERLPEVGGLRPYACSFHELQSIRRRTRRVWRSALADAGVPRKARRADGSLQDGSWNPVRLTRHGTVELRSPDANLPTKAMALTDLVHRAARLVFEDGLRVAPTPGLREPSLASGKLLVPDFEYLRGELLPEAVFGDTPRGGRLEDYLRSLADLTLDGAGPALQALGPQGIPATTEEWFLENAGHEEGRLEESAALALVVQACERLEAELFGAAARDEAPLAK